MPARRACLYDKYEPASTPRRVPSLLVFMTSTSSRDKRLVDDDAARRAYSVADFVAARRAYSATRYEVQLVKSNRHSLISPHSGFFGAATETSLTLLEEDWAASRLFCIDFL